MPFREKLRKVMSRSTDQSNESSSPRSSRTASRKNSNIYQPGEVIPYKYRRPVAPEHKEKLEAFSFAAAWRRKSHQSQYSPMGSRAVSRRNSVASQLRRGFAKRGQGSVASVTSGLREESKMDPLRVNSAKDSQQEDSSIADKDFADRSADSPQHDTPFSPEELTLAMQRSHIGVPAQG